MKQIIVNNFSTWYYITEDGKCYNSKTNKWLKGQVKNYLTYYITLPTGDKKRIYAHRAVAQAYIPNPNNKREVNHIDGNRLNNCIDNLEWATPKENQQHSLITGLRQYNHIYCFTPDKKLVAEYVNAATAARATGISLLIILQELQKDVKTLSGGFYWSKDNILGETKNYTNNGKAKQVNQYDLKGKYIMTYPSTGIAAKAINGKHSHISECCRGKIKSYKGFIWKYVDDIVSTIDESQ